jgi:hypothetical protein
VYVINSTSISVFFHAVLYLISRVAWHYNVSARYLSYSFWWPCTNLWWGWGECQMRWDEMALSLLKVLACLCGFEALWHTVPSQLTFPPLSLSMLTTFHFVIASQAINPCLQNICHPHAHCTYLGPNQHSCTCQEGYSGDGQVCLPVDPCQTNFGNCPAQSTVCKYDGPGQVS